MRVKVITDELVVNKHWDSNGIEGMCTKYLWWEINRESVWIELKVVHGCLGSRESVG